MQTEAYIAAELKNFGERYDVRRCENENGGRYHPEIERYSTFSLSSVGEYTLLGRRRSGVWVRINEFNPFVLRSQLIREQPGSVHIPDAACRF